MSIFHRILLIIGCTFFISILLFKMYVQSTNVSILASFVSNYQKNNNTELDYILINEAKTCLCQASKKGFNILDENKLNKNADKIIKNCINIMMSQHLRNDASRYDFLSKKFEQNGITFDLSKTKSESELYF